MKSVLIMAGGTGGHIMPALAVAKLLQNKGVNVVWLGSQQGMEETIVPAAGIKIEIIAVKKMRGKGLLRLLLTPFNLTRAVLQANKIIKRLNPDCVIGFGGFVAGPGGIAAYLLKKTLVIHEQNSVAGYTNRLLAKLAKTTLQAFPNAFGKESSAVTIGNPVRDELIQIAPPVARWQNKKTGWRILVLGGSQGAAFLNETLPKAIAALDPQLRPEIWHIAGKGKNEQVQKAYDAEHVQVRVSDYVEDMKSAYEWADFVICRSGALTVSELAAVGLGSLLIPFPYAVDDHQTYNAKFLADANAGILMQQKDVNAEQLQKILLDLVQNPARLLQMAEAAYRLRKIDAAQQVVNYCELSCHPKR